MSTSEQPSRLAGAIGLMAVIGLLLVVYGVSRWSGDPTASPTTTSDFTARSTTTLAGARPPEVIDAAPTVFVNDLGWTALGSPDLPVAPDPLVVDADDRILVVGPTTRSDASGVIGGAYRPGTWTAIPTVDLSFSAGAVGAWNGTELLVYADGIAAYDPDANRWRSVQVGDSNVDPSLTRPMAAVATEDEVVVFGYRTDTPDDADSVSVAALNGSLACCRELDDVPFETSFLEAVWTGSEILAIGRGLAALDPVTGTWRILESPPFTDATDVTATVINTTLFASTNGGDFASWTEASGWVELPPAPRDDAVRTHECVVHLQPVAAGVLQVGCDRAAIWSVLAKRWITIVTPEAWTHRDDTSCTPTPRDGDQTTMYLWCAGDTTDPSFWRLLPSVVETSRFGDVLADGSPWEVLPNPALDSHGDADMVWTGTELLFLCGFDPDSGCTGGWGYDPSTSIFHRMPDMDAASSGQSAVWIGDELLVVRGITTAYDPFSLAWRTTAPGPPLGRSSSAVWTGSEVIFFGSARSTSSTGVTYRPRDDVWSNMAAAPLEPTSDPLVTWSGSEMYVFGGWIFDEDGVSPSQAGAAYDPITNTWRLLPPLPGDGLPNNPGDRQLSGHIGGFVDGRLVVLGANWEGLDRQGAFTNEPLVAGFSYDPRTDAWTEIPPPRDPARTFEGFSGSMSAVGHGDEIAVFFRDGTGSASIGFYRPATDAWRYVDGAPGDAYGPNLVSGHLESGDRFIAYRSPIGTVLLHDVPVSP